MGPVRSLKTAQNRLLFGGVRRDDAGRKPEESTIPSRNGTYGHPIFERISKRAKTKGRSAVSVCRTHLTGSTLLTRETATQILQARVCVYNINIHNCVSRPPPRFILKLVSVKCGRTRMKRVCNATDNITPAVADGGRRALRINNTILLALLLYVAVVCNVPIILLCTLYTPR